jgi:hypothetical protein
MSITNAQFNTLISNGFTTLDQYGVGSGPHGLGQNTQYLYTVVPSRTVLSISNWNTAFSTINAVLQHEGKQAITPSTISNFSQLDACYNDYLNGASNAYTSSGITGLPLTTDIPNVVANTKVWKGPGSKLEFTNTITFPSGDAARYFFNAGGQILITPTVVNTTTWNAFCQACGQIIIGYRNTSKLGGSGTHNVLLDRNNGGYWSGLESYVTHFQQYNSVASYTSDFIKVEYCWSGAEGHGGFSELNIKTTFYNVNGLSLTDGSVSLSVASPSNIYLTESWGVPIVTGEVKVLSNITSSIWACGDNMYGQVGNGTTTTVMNPTQIQV